MRYYVLDRGDQLSAELAEQFHQLAAQRHFVIDAVSPEIVISIGGDGTMLHAFHTFVNHIPNIAFVGVHTGHLGFYSDWKSDELAQLIELMSHDFISAENTARIVKYPLLELTIHKKSGTTTHVALNEFTLKGVYGTLVAQIDINQASFEMFRGDGICVSTPSGSTAYNKSLGGAMVHPSIEAIQIAEIASINNRVYRTMGAPLLLPKHHECNIYPNQDQRLLITIDHIVLPVDDLISVSCKVSEQKISFARYRPYPFWDRVKSAFLR
ncbi:NAD kinase [Paenibacillus crassostreae]|uniref:NAD kinase n=1 Tax=Paenibacillus crassostreae TaxID=1763538 RepID=A0A167CT27_9BACL|nr:NAD kinase [Paenibacillus crassostreae]AOZ93527.1 NAD kinase [Paenibacillus crassostreae]OAB73549.1 NAD(+) kinase [Paenibacillus crassostreae]